MPQRNLTMVLRRHVGIETYPKGYMPQHLTHLNKRVNVDPASNLSDNNHALASAVGP